MIIRMTVFWTVCTPNYIAISQIMQQNCRMNALTSKLWFRARAMWPSDHFRLHVYTARCIYVQKHRKCELRACLIGRVPRHLLPLWNAKPQIQSLVCTLRNSNIAITSQIAKFEWSFKLRTLLKCENTKCLEYESHISFKTHPLNIIWIKSKMATYRVQNFSLTPCMHILSWEILRFILAL